MAKKVKDDEEAQTHGSNVPDGEKLMSFIQRVENLEADKATERGEYMQRCKVIGEDIDQVFTEAKNAGFRKKALKAQLKRRTLERKLEEVADNLEGDDSDAFAAMSLALEKMGPLGEAAIKAAA